MDDHLDPVILGKLSHFRRRLRLLEILRGLFLALIAALGLLLLLIAADWVLALSDSVRTWLLRSAVLGVGLLLVRAIVRACWGAPDLRATALLLEQAQPELREDLLASVELSNLEVGRTWDSMAFRNRLRHDVASRMSGLDIGRVLPLGRLQHFWTTSLVLLLVLAIVAAVPSGRAHLRRVAAPGRVNIGTTSESDFHVLQPADPENAFAPRGASMPVLVEVNSRAIPDQPHIQTDDGAGHRVQVVMNLVDQGNATLDQPTRRYASAVPMDADTMRYRFLAGRRQSKWYTVRIQDPPRVLGFIKQFQFPAYSALPPALLREAHGHVEILEGTQVRLIAGIDQELKSAMLRHVQGGVTNEVEMEPAGDPDAPKSRSARFTILTNGIYTLHLVAAHTGMANKPGEEYRIKALPDERPEVTIQSPEGDVARRPEDVLAISALARDDVALKEVRQLFQVISASKTNAWTTNVLALPQLPQANATLELAFDLLPLDVKPSDVVLTRLVAVDVKGQTGESALLTLRVESAVFESRRIEALKPKQSILRAARDLRDSIAKLRQAIPDDLADRPLGDLRQARDDSEKSPAIIISKIAALHQALASATAKARPGRESAELVLLSHTLSRMEHEQLPFTRLQAAFDDATQETRADRTRAASAAVAKLAELAGRLAENARLQLAADEAAVLVDHLDYLAQSQRWMNRLAGAGAAPDDTAGKRLARRQAAATKDILGIQQLMTQAAPQFDIKVAAELNATGAQLGADRLLMETALKAGDANGTLLGPSLKFQASVEKAAGVLRPLHRAAVLDAAVARKQLEVDLQGADRPFVQLGDRLKAWEGAQAATKGAQGAAAKLAGARSLLAEEWARQAARSAMAQLRARAVAEAGRVDTDQAFVKDLFDAAQAIEHIAQSTKTPADQAAQLAALAQSLGTLEQSHRLVELEGSLNALSQLERWRQDATDLNTLRVRDWQWHRDLFDRLPPDLRKTRLAAQAAELIEQAGASAEARAISAEMDRRNNTPGTFTIEGLPK